MSGIYVHIPFCQKKCRYCDFISFDNCSEESKEMYVENVVKEIQNTQIAQKIDTIYIGGGTPSNLKAEKIQKILQVIFQQFDVSKNAEITI